jgi:DNA-damage-inducible protein D
MKSPSKYKKKRIHYLKTKTSTKKLTMNKEIAVFENSRIRRYYDENNEVWYFSIIDIIHVLTQSSNPRDYWFKMKIRVKTEDGFELSTICRQFKLKANDGKRRETDTADVQGIFRIIQSIPSAKAEPFKQWLAKVGYERLQEIQDPSLSIDRARENWKTKGRSEKWEEVTPESNTSVR